MAEEEQMPTVQPELQSVAEMKDLASNKELESVNKEATMTENGAITASSSPSASQLPVLEDQFDASAFQPTSQGELTELQVVEYEVEYQPDAIMSQDELTESQLVEYEIECQADVSTSLDGLNKAQVVECEIECQPDANMSLDELTESQMVEYEVECQTDVPTPQDGLNQSQVVECEVECQLDATMSQVELAESQLVEYEVECQTDVSTPQDGLNKSQVVEYEVECQAGVSTSQDGLDKSQVVEDEIESQPGVSTSQDGLEKSQMIQYEVERRPDVSTSQVGLDKSHVAEFEVENQPNASGSQDESSASQVLECQPDASTSQEESRSKRPRTDIATRNSKAKVMHHKANSGSRCSVCKQKLNDEQLKLYGGHPNNAMDEYNTLIDNRLSLFNGNEEDVNEKDLRAVNKITSFSVYCKAGHLCPFDSGLIEGEANIYVSGYVKPIYEDDPSIEGGIPCKDIGPIVEWFVTGFDGCPEAKICLVSAAGEYYLMQPSEDYARFMLPVKEKTFISKTVIEFLLDEPTSEYEDLLNKFETTPMPQGIPRFTEDLLVYHAQFVCDQIVSFDDSATEEDPLLIESPCVQSLIDLAGVTLRKSFRKKVRRRDEDYPDGFKSSQQKKPSWTKATTTREVHSMFESCFPGQLENTADKLLLKRRRCGACEVCLQPDCGECSNCKNMIKYGGSGTSKQACVKRRCPNMQIVEENDVDEEQTNDRDECAIYREASIEVYRKIMKTLKKNQKASIQWIGDPVTTEKGDFYESVMVNSDVYEINDYIFVEPKNSTVPMQVFHIKYLRETNHGLKVLHGTWLWRGNETILGESSVSRELFLVDECQEIPLDCIQSKANVLRQQFWDDGDIIKALKENSMLLFYRKRYDHITARFEDLLPELEPPNDKKHEFCTTCANNRNIQKEKALQVFEELKETTEDGMVQYGMIKYMNEEYRVGSAVYLKPKTFQLKYMENQKETIKSSKRELIDEEKYPEFYRKYGDKVKGSNIDTPEPYNIGYITRIYSTTKIKLKTGTNLRVMLKKFYRPENTVAGESLIKKCDFNQLYWTDEECDVQFSQVIRKCYVAYSANLGNQDLSEWSAMGPDRFYFTEAYDSKNQDYVDPPPPHACNIGRISKDKNAKSKSKRADVHYDQPPIFPPISKKLRTLDIFAGCGGLSEGLKQSGVAESMWAIENDEAAAHAYRLNNPNAAVFTTDCNTFLEKVMKGETTLVGQKVPQKGEVDLLCGGPPCQGFSAMNRFNSRVNATFKNSLIVTFVSFCDYYRPRYIVMENVRSFATFKKGAVLKLVLSFLVRMGYQCSFGILQAGSYGVPQTRRRLILIAAAPGEILPQFPTPLHVFSKSVCHRTVEIDNEKYYTLKLTPDDSAPYRVITVYDALSDLPPIRSGSNHVTMSYPEDSTTAFQRKMREGMIDCTLLFDHICKDMGPLIEARMTYIPIKPGSDWRDLPNIVIRLSDGSFSNKLEYRYYDDKSGNKTILRGVCSCAEGKACNNQDKQLNTLIPWCLPHTANRHNHWAGLYGRIEWDGFFSTTITNPEPMGKQGRVLHPEQHRVVSVRECARSQGFPDSFRFYGNIQDKHRQIGNAVPPPLAAAIGFEIRKSLSLKETQQVPAGQAEVEA